MNNSRARQGWRPDHIQTVPGDGLYTPSEGVPMQVPLTTREAWLTHFAEQYLWPRIESAGAQRPHKYRVSVGFPKGRRGNKGHSIGQCWSQEVSADQTCEIFVSPELDAAQAVAVLSHEACHAAVGVRHGHRAPFKKLALAIGLSGPM